MKRRDFSFAAGALAASIAGLGNAQAQNRPPANGTDYQTLSVPVPTDVPAGKLEVIEFFWYGCPHCNAFEPELEAWTKRLPKDVVLRRVPVAFNSSLEPHQRIYFALEAMNLLDKLHAKVFYAIHVDRQRLLNESDIVKWMSQQGVDAAAFTAQYKAFTTQSKIQRANQLANTLYKIDGVPMLGVGGRYLTAPSIAGSGTRALQVTDYLLAELRKAR